MRFIERFRRRSVGHLQVDVTVEAPVSSTKPFTVCINRRLLPAES